MLVNVKSFVVTLAAVLIKVGGKGLRGHALRLFADDM